MGKRSKKWGRYRNCKNCIYSAEPKDLDKLPCGACHRNPNTADNWIPSEETARKIVMHYVENAKWFKTKNISAIEIADTEEVPVKVIAATMVQLMKEGVLKTETTMVIVE